MGEDIAVLKGRGFSRAARLKEGVLGFIAPEGTSFQTLAFPRRLTPRLISRFDGTAKGVPFQSNGFFRGL
jgi:hypothetical protein